MARTLKFIHECRDMGLANININKLFNVELIDCGHRLSPSFSRYLNEYRI